MSDLIRKTKGSVLQDLLSQWPLLKQIETGADGTGREAMSEKTKNLRTKHDGAQVATSICPYCGVGCGQLVFHKNNKLGFDRFASSADRE
jgi:formate dehydrogenase major subunit